MKQFIISCIASLAFLSSLAQSKISIDISGKNLSPAAKVFVRYMVDKKVRLDSVKFTNSKAFYSTEIEEPTIVMLFLSKDGAPFFGKKNVKFERITFYAEPTQKLTKVRFSDSFENAVVTGGKLQKDYKKYSHFMAEYDKQLDLLFSERSQIFQTKERDEKLLKQVTDKIDAVNREKDKGKEAFIQSNPKSYFSLQALKELAGYDIDADRIEPLFRKLSLNLQNSDEGIYLRDEIELSKILGIGKIAPDFTQNDTTGTPVSLTNFRGKYVLLDFWASWCGPCRAENPNVVKAYNKYKDKNFTVLGVSLDRPDKKQAWLDAIHKDNLTWTHVSDLQYWDNAVAKQYGIRAIPQNLLIDPNGKIVAKNIRGEELQTKLAEILDK